MRIMLDSLLVYFILEYNHDNGYQGQGRDEVAAEKLFSTADLSVTGSETWS